MQDNTSLGYSLIKSSSYESVTYFQTVTAVGIFIGTKNKLDSLCDILTVFFHFVIIDVGFNEIQLLESNCFENGYNLKVIKLNNNKIFRLHQNAFQNLIKLMILDLSNNLLSSINSHGITNSSQYFYFIIQENNK